MGLARAFDVFFSYSTRDHAAVERIARDLTGYGIRIFLDRWYLTPGQPWPQALEQTISACSAVAVFIGGEGLGPWQQRERDLALDRQGREPGFPVIPVLLTRADPALGFLKLNTWVDLSAGVSDPEALAILSAAIRREPPGPLARQRSEAILAAVCPYRGLQAFREEDEPFFFGRTAFAETLTAAILRQPLIAVVGASGSGKSSVVRAGLIPRLRRGAGNLVWGHPGSHRSPAAQSQRGPPAAARTRFFRGQAARRSRRPRVPAAGRKHRPARRCGTGSRETAGHRSSAGIR